MVGELMRPRIGQGGDTNEPSFAGISMMRLGSPSHGVRSSTFACMTTDADREATVVMFPQGRWGEPDDASRLITWLLTDEARWITGQVINSEGGFARWRR